MKNFTFFILLFLLVSDLFAQSTDAVNYQVVIRGTAGQLVTDKAIGVQVSLLQGGAQGTVSYQETHAVSTNANGLISIAIGTGVVTSGTYAAIDWSLQPYYVRTSVDLSGGTSYTEYSTTQLTSVPYALKAKTTDALTTPFIQGNGTTVTNNKVGMANGVHANNVKVWDGLSWVNRSITAQTSLTGDGQSVVARSPYLAMNYQMTTIGIFPSRNGVDNLIGEIMLFAGNFEVKGFAICNGQLLPKSTNAALFSLLGTTFGGDGVNNFALPDLRGREVVHFGTGTGLNAVNYGEMGGTESINLATQNIPSHRHPTLLTFPAP